MEINVFLATNRHGVAERSRPGGGGVGVSVIVMVVVEVLQPVKEVKQGRAPRWIDFIKRRKSLEVKDIICNSIYP